MKFKEGDVISRNIHTHNDFGIIQNVYLLQTSKGEPYIIYTVNWLDMRKVLNHDETFIETQYKLSRKEDLPDNMLAVLISFKLNGEEYEEEEL